MSADPHSTISTPSQSLAAVFRGQGQPLELQWFQVPVLESGEALVRVECCTICGSDLHTVLGKRHERTPTILGHEICGRVTEIGAATLRTIDGTPLEIGDRVTWSTSVSCGHCDRCLTGLPQKCRTLRKFGHESTESGWPLSGGLSQFVHLKVGSQVVKLSERLPLTVACPANCATATVSAACRKAGSLAGARVLIFGAGMLGLTAAAMTKSLGARTVVLCDPNPQRLGLAREFGVDTAVVWEGESSQQFVELLADSRCATFDVLLELSGAPEAVEAACALGDIGAQVILVGTVMNTRPAQINPESLVRRWISIHGVHNYTPQDLSSAVAFLVQHQSRFPFQKLVSQIFSLEDVNAALAYAIEHRPVRIAVIP